MQLVGSLYPCERPPRGWPSSGRELELIVGRQRKSERQPLDRIAMRMAPAALQPLDAVHTKPGALRQGFLRELCRQPMPPQQLAKGDGCH